MEDLRIRVEVEVNPTESIDKVKAAVENIFATLDMREESVLNKRVLVGEAEGKASLTKFCNILRRDRIRDAARKVFFEGMDKRTIVFCLNKQVAYTGQISFSKEVAESPLGPIKVKITCADPRRVIDWLTAKDT
ncbi:MAG: RNA-binding domain-containing protein [Candidatus Bathyarchaeota archaeon]|nr:RNA-binding domain-containing protein [Candidatus Bathyarchaeota archaeon]